MNILYSKHPQSYSWKLTEEDIKTMTFINTQASVDDWIAEVEAGRPFTCQHYKKSKRKNDNFLTQNVFALDFAKKTNFKIRASFIMVEQEGQTNLLEKISV